VPADAAPRALYCLLDQGEPWIVRGAPVTEALTAPERGCTGELHVDHAGNASLYVRFPPEGGVEGLCDCPLDSSLAATGTALSDALAETHHRIAAAHEGPYTEPCRSARTLAAVSIPEKYEQQALVTTLESLDAMIDSAIALHDRVFETTENKGL